MRIKNTLVFLAIACFLYTISMVYSGCAQVGMPTGGLKDTLPPVLLNSNPPNETVNFNKDRIILTFDEYVQLQDVQQNLLVSPVPKVNPNVDYKLKTVTIRLKDTLLQNTTYKIELGTSIRDLNEGNPFRDFSFIFSTGAHIDSLTFSGNVEIAETGQTDSTLFVFLYRDLSDSAVFKKKPTYITRVNAKGEFTFSNLAAGDYHVFALKDESGQKMYTSKTQMFAFADSSIRISESSPTIKLFAYQEEKEAQKTSTTTTKPTTELKFTSSLANGVQDLLNPLELIFNQPLKDIKENQLILTDTLFNPVPMKSSVSDTLNKKIKISSEWTEDSYYKLIINKAFATDTAGVALAHNDTLSFKTKKENEYGSIKIKFENLDKFKHPVLQFVKNKVVEYSYPLTGAQFYQKLFVPGDYEIRILEDSNQNGVWDPGYYDPANIHLQKQPEKVISIPQTLNIKAGWDNERDIILE